MELIKLQLGESNEIKFKLQIQGVTSNHNEAKPKIRFFLAEKELPDSGFMLPVAKNDDGFVVVDFTAYEKFFQPDKIYEGSIEILIGNRYFNAAKYNVSFIKEMKIEVESVIVNNKNIISEETNKDVIEFKAEIVEEPVKKESKPKKPEIIPKELGVSPPKYLNNKTIKENSIKNKLREAIKHKLPKPINNELLEKITNAAYTNYNNKLKD